MAIVEVLDALPKDYERRGEVIELFQKVMRSVVEYQDETSGVWYDVLDVVDSRNYLEATCSSMFAYCLLKGARLGYLDKSYLKAGMKAYRGIVKEFIKVNGDGTLSLTKCCSVSGLGPDSNPKRDGSFEYYMSESIRDNDGKGVGPFIWASLEMEQMGYNTTNLDEDLTGGLPPDLLEPSGWGACGDANGDGVVSVGDVLAVANYIQGNEPSGFDKTVADVNGDGVVNVGDVIAIVNILLQEQ